MDNISYYRNKASLGSGKLFRKITNLNIKSIYFALSVYDITLNYK